MERGKAAIVNALVGLAIVLMARVIAGMIQSSLGSRGRDNGHTASGDNAPEAGAMCVWYARR
jgi:hypothetical protein